MAIGNVTPTTAAKYIATVWTKEIEKPFYSALYFAKLVLQRGDVVQGGGNVITVPFLSIYNARTKVAGTAVTYDTATETAILININRQVYLAILIEDIAKVQANYNLQEIYRGAQAEAVARQIDTDLASLYTGAGSTIAAGPAVTDANMIATVLALDTANVPLTERYGVIGVGAHSDLLNVNKYTTYDSTGKRGNAVDPENWDMADNTMVASVYGFDLMKTNQVAVVAGAPNLGQEMFFHKSALSLALQLPPTYKMEDSADYIGMKTVLHAVYGVQVERPSALAVVTRNATA
jgi:hypothetical protein